ncbi:polysaccharide deacetylase family protein [Clostridium estertheticum]|uniref:polysaccharide deacetylase family protein n=1 Tax=Clostridium estertheticum TaxID=238834 RepID=UPI001CF20543|nr:polysaccharide deacetylase family protein [Clostridium estertheticum]MCB2355208.1 polysaccharide deacetylase [Clostridium estertheticum]WAG39496.1 polysaccharide deacetylase [Clostridium estertheticum]
MINLEKRKKRRIRKRRKFGLIISVIVIVILSCLIFYINSNSKVKKVLPANAENSLKKSVATPKKVTLKPKLKSPTADFYKHIYKSDGHKIAYLSFDDGPSANNTPVILKTLDKYNIKATFFIVGNMAIKYPDLVKKELADGHSIGNHSYSHNYNYLYSNTNTFISDINKCDTILKSILGSNFSTKLVRFPGGSFGGKLKPFRESLNSAGYNYVDWNDLTGDAEGQNIPASKLLSNLKKNTEGKDHVVILMHDFFTKSTTAQALPQVIEYLKSQKYSFKTLN